MTAVFEGRAPNDARRSCMLPQASGVRSAVRTASHVLNPEVPQSPFRDAMIARAP